MKMDSDFSSNHFKNSDCVQSISLQLLDPKKTTNISQQVLHVLPEIFGWITNQIGSIKRKNFDAMCHSTFCVALSKLITMNADVQKLTMNYLKNSPSPFYSLLHAYVSPPKKMKVQFEVPVVSEKQILEGTLYIIQCLLDDMFIEEWNWTEIATYLASPDIELKWICCNILSIVGRMSSYEYKQFVNNNFTSSQKIELADKFGRTYQNQKQVVCLKENIKNTYSVKIGDVLLPHKNFNWKRSKGILEDLPSTSRNLEVIALSLSTNKPVLLEGVVGSGKTCHVEHLAKLTGRASAPSLTKVQLGGQTDGKSLIGTYRCTENPGEFIWLPGTITQAVTEGHWLLLEDIDTAPMDVVSLLYPLLESRTLPVPGKGVIKAHTEFQLFATRRVFQRGQKKSSKSMGIIEKLFFKVTLDPLSTTELITLISTKFPALTTIAEKLVEVYLVLSSGEHSEDSLSKKCVQCASVSLTSANTSGRLVSVRDLMKWCTRIARHINKRQLNEKSCYEAIDCFCSAIADERLRRRSANHIGAHLNMTAASITWFFNCRPEISEGPQSFSVGRSPKIPSLQGMLRSQGHQQTAVFSQTLLSMRLLEKVSVAVSYDEPVLIVGETGTGKTSIVQYLSQKTNNILKVINMNQQSDSSDLLGGFKPVEMRMVLAPLRTSFESAFEDTFKVQNNTKFLKHISNCVKDKSWKKLFQLYKVTSEKAINKCKSDSERSQEPENKELLNKWKKFCFDLHKAEQRLHSSDSALAFSFIEGTLATAISKGHWVLLDEINLASADTLECLSGLLESNTGSLTLHERGDKEPIKRHQNFKLFACMNPATDVGKKDLPAGLRNRFTEFFMDEFESESDLKQLVHDYLFKANPTPEQIDGIVKFYFTVRSNNCVELADGTGKRPYFSLRTLCRALSVAQTNPCSNLNRSIYEAFCLAFLTQLDRSSHPAMKNLIKQLIFGTEHKKLGLGQPLPPPKKENSIKVGNYWLSQGSREPKNPQKYIITETVRANLEDIIRVVSLGKFPVLLQGDTSVGKTSLITYLAARTGNQCVRINNHQHTDLQEYVGSYSPNEFGKLVFKEGVLVEAMRNGHWVILDELNLAPTDVLEALNRLLDDNRELYIPEIDAPVKAHPNFMLFATQNPPGLYGGRQVLSRAFRNRFVELHFDLIPPKELEVILHERCEVPLSYSKKMVAVLDELQKMRRDSNALQGNQSFITLRDLFRWAERYRLAPKQSSGFYDWDQHLVDEGYLVLGCRVRKENEEEAILKALKKHMKRDVKYDSLFTLGPETSPVTAHILRRISNIKGFEHIEWTRDMTRLFVLVSKALGFQEPVLLVGETGCGKTSVCQLIAGINNQTLSMVNCHLHTEGVDFLGGLRPVRSRSEKDDSLFEWVDGPLVLSMKAGGLFLIDEISLADDSVLERLNSVLEPERTLFLAEKGSAGKGDFGAAESVVADQNFKLVGTMNPGGDFGKKELSPALRNRFTEIWCPTLQINETSDDARRIVEHNVNPGIVLTDKFGDSGIGRAMLSFLSKFRKSDIGSKCIFTIRDLLSWTYFINKVTMQSDVPLHEAYIHGACLVILDSLGSGTTASATVNWNELRDKYIKLLCLQMKYLGFPTTDGSVLLSENSSSFEIINTELHFGISPFLVNKAEESYAVESRQFSFDAPKTSLNLLRLLRGLQLSRPLLLEGSPGVGKTSLAVALAKVTGHKVVRINLSEQTDVSDLFGADLPVEGEVGGHFAWRDGPLLQALKDGAWIVLDELNLASQQVLEGLNACFDHRGEIYVSELNKTFKVKQQTKIFACQNPYHQGGNRKGLPKSFLNRFTQVYMEAFSSADMEFILSNMYPEIPKDTLCLMVEFNTDLLQSIAEEKWGRSGGPWELNLRDLCRWCEIMIKNQTAPNYNPGEFVHLIYVDRMRNSDDRTKILHVYDRVFPSVGFEFYIPTGKFFLTPQCVQFGHAILPRHTDGDQATKPAPNSLFVLQSQTTILESLVNCINMNWMAILVGPSGKGKTSVLQLLSQLSGKKLQTLSVNSEMDVTELLGGFEQADYGRHLQELLDETKGHLLRQYRLSLLSANLPEASGFVRQWQEIHHKKEDSEGGSSLEEAKHYSGLFKSLQVLLTKFSKHYSVDLSEMIRKCESLATRLETSKKIIGGGTFEWIDSPLVKAICSGDWLVIDGANLCSSSVLDRLNALLEPGGVLRLSERGVIDGSIPCLVPHPEFRLFLSMNSNNGEISRAMRNRGIEIFVNEDWEVTFDVQSLMLSQNLSSVPLQNTIYNIHCLISMGLPRYLKPTLSQMMQASCMVQKLSELGVPSSQALKQSLCLTYSRICQNTNQETRIKDIIDSSMDALKTEESLQQNSLLALLVDSHQLLTNHADYFPRQLCSWLQMISSKAKFVMREKPLGISMALPKNESFILRAVFTCLTALPVAQWEVLVLLAKQHLEEPLKNTIVNIMIKAITELPVAFKRLEEAGHIIADPRHNIAACRYSLMSEDEITSSANKACLLLWHKLNESEEDQEPKRLKKLKVQGMSLLQLSKAAQRGRIGSLCHKSISYIAPLFESITDLLETVCADQSFQLTDSLYFQLMEGLQWSAVFKNECSKILPKNAQHLLHPELVFYWKQLVKFFIEKLPSRVCGSFDAAVSGMQASFESDCSPLYDVAHEARSGLSKLAPFVQSKMFKIFEDLVKLAVILTPDQKSYSLNSFLASREGISVKCRLLNLSYQLLDLNSLAHTQLERNKSEVFSKILDSKTKFAKVDEVEKYLEKRFKQEYIDLNEKVNNLTSHVESTLPNWKSTTEYDFSVQVWPIRDHLIYTMLSTDRSAAEKYEELMSRASFIPPNVLWNLNRSKTIPLTSTYIFRISNCSGRQSKRWLCYGQKKEDIENEEETTPLASATASILSFQMVSAFCDSSKELESIPLDAYAQREDQLKKTQSTIFHNWNYFNDDKHSVEKSFLKQTEKFSLRILGALCESLPDTSLPARSTFPDKLVRISELSGILSKSSYFAEGSQLLHRLSEQAFFAQNEKTNGAMAKLGILSGVLQTWVLSHMDLLDPAIKRNIFLSFYDTESQNIQNVDLVNKWLEVLRFSHNQNDSHPHVSKSLENLSNIENEQKNLLRKVAYREKTSVYTEIATSVRHFVQTILSPVKIMEMLDELPRRIALNDFCETMLTSCDNFVNEMVRSFPSFRDILFPILEGVCLVAEDLRWLCHSIRMDSLNKALRQTLDNESVTVDTIISDAFNFPVHRDFKVMGDVLQESKTQNRLVRFSESILSDNQMMNCRNLSVRSKLYQLHNSVVAEGFLRENMFTLFNEIIAEVLVWLQKQKEEKLQKEEDEAASYKYKARSLATNETEEEEAEREFKEAFPDFEDHFEDFDNEFYDSSKHANSPEDNIYFTEEHLYELIRVHCTCMKLFNNKWLKPDFEGVTALPVTSSLLRLQQISLIYSNFGPVTSEAVDKHGVSAVALSNHVTKSSLSNPIQLKLSQRPFNIYQDPSVNETLKAAPLLRTLDKRIDNLLVQWPGHPALLSVKLVIKRVLEFPVTSPLIKLIIGLETVFEKAQIWEKNAHKGVSILTDLTNIAHQILSWREMELNSWKSCLDMLSYEIDNKSYQWWHSLYETLMMYKCSEIVEISKTLKQFIEMACLGDFEARLSLLFTFHCHMCALLETCDGPDRSKLSQLVSTTWNLHHYYVQFLPQVKDALCQQRTPIEKGLKGYIKICTFNSSKNAVNFFAVKEKVVKSRRALHRYMRKWKKVLLQPASSFFSDSGAFDSKERQNDVPSQPRFSIDHTRPAMPSGCPDSLSALFKMSSKCGTLIQKTMENMSYGITVDALEELTTEIASSFQKLALDAARADNLTDKEERTKHVRGIIHRKRESLSLLMKNLQSIGISYLRGNTIWKDEDLAKCLTVSPLDFSTEDDSTSNEFVGRTWMSCNQYYYKCVGRYSCLRKTITKPHSDLNTELIKRVTGYASHLMVYVKDIRQTLPQFSHTLSSLKFMRDELRLASQGFYSNANDQVEWWSELSSFVATFKMTISECDIFLSSCVTGTPLVELCPASFDPAKVQVTREILSSIIHDLDQIKSPLHRHVLRSKFEKSVTLSSVQNIEDLRSVFRDISLCVSKAEKAHEELNLSNQSTVSDTFENIKHFWDSLNKRFTQWQNSINLLVESNKNSALVTDTKNLEQMLMSVFLSVQGLYKDHEITHKSDEPASDNYLSCSIETFHKDLKNLNIVGVKARLQSMCETIQSSVNPWEMQVLPQLLINLDNYTSLCENLLISMTGTFRSVSKLQSVLLSIFTQLATRGFCRPSDIKEGGSGEGQMSFEDSGMGLAEGEGKKDVSDRIESEDQLDSALKEGEQENSADSDVPEEKGGIEMSEDFDGKMQDVQQEDDENGEAEEENDSDDLDKQMGDVGNDGDILDEKLWEDNEPDEETSKSTEEEAAGGEAQTESQMVAKEDDTPQEKNKKDKNNLETMEEDTRQPNNENEPEDYGDDFTDDFHQKPDDPVPDETLPDMLSLEDMEEQEQGKEDDPELDPSIPQKSLFPEDESPPTEEQKPDDSEDEAMSQDGDQPENKESEQDLENPDIQSKSAEALDDEVEVSEPEDDAPRTANKQVQPENCEPAEDNERSSSKDNTKNQPMTEKGGHEDEDHQEDHGETGEMTEDAAGVGKSDSKSKQDSHEGNMSQLTAHQESDSGKQPESKRNKPGDVDENRTVGNNAEKIKQGLVSKETSENVNNDEDAAEESEIYEHVANADDKIDQQIVDAGTQDQAQSQPAPKTDHEESDEDQMEGITDQLPEENDEKEELEDIKQVKPEASKNDTSKDKSSQASSERKDSENKLVTEGDAIMEMTVERPSDNSFFTQALEEEAEIILGEDNQSIVEAMEVCGDGDVEMGEKKWKETESVVSSLAQQLCEQLRLILEPTQASKLKGDFRIGKRLNMRKVISYIASDFRKDKIWLRRTQPNKRNYQVMIAVDDSESMNAIKATDLARQGVAVVGTALELLEVGSIGVVSFGSSTKVIHRLGDPFSHNAVSNVMANLQFDQKQTNFVQMLKDCRALLMSADGSGNQDTVQLLLILSDGQNRAGSKAVKAAVQAARGSRVFIVFLVLDAQNETNYSFYDTLVWDNGEMKSIMDTFPFPYFLVVRDMTTLPDVLCSALRQWFELVSSGIY